MDIGRGISCWFLLGLCLLVNGGNASALWDSSEEDQCDDAIWEIINEDRATVVDESSSRLHATWISQECEIRTGPEYVIRKYTFFENGTFLLMRHHYAEESCSIATHSVTARGSIKLLGESNGTPGATETRYQLDSVHVSPLNRQVAHKLGHRVNVSCGPQPRWRPYVAQLIYERAPERYAGGGWSAQGPRYNSLQPGQEHQPIQTAQQHHHHHHQHPHHQHHQHRVDQLPGAGLLRSKSVDCLAPLNIDFEELKLIRVQRRPNGFRSAGLGDADKMKYELFLGSLPPDYAAKRTHRPTSLQPTALLRTDTIQNCPICGAIARGTENSPPLLHEVVALPALLGGSWISPTCESHPGGIWLRRQLRIYAGDKLWTGRWDYFSDSRCSSYLYGITAAGSYAQRARRQRRHDSGPVAADEVVPSVVDRTRRSLDELEYYRQILQSAQPSNAESFAAMLRGNQRRDEQPTRKPQLQSPAPSGTTELDLHVAESLLVVGDAQLARRCGADIGDEATAKNTRLANWAPGCVPHSLESPSTLGLRARISVDWYGHYSLLLGARNKHLWDAPLLQCGPTSMNNPQLRSHLRRSVGLRYGILFNNGAHASAGFGLVATLLFQLIVVSLGYFVVR